MSYKLFAQRMGLTGIANAIVSLSALLLIPILTKNLGAEAYGVWSQILVTIYLIGPFCTLGLGYAITRFLAPEKDICIVSRNISSIFFITALLGLISSGLLFAFSEVLAVAVFGGVEAAFYIKISSLLIFFAAIDQIVMHYLTGFQQIKRYSFYLVSRSIAEIIAIGFFITFGFGLSGAIVSLIVVRLFMSIIAGYWISSDVGISLPHFYDVKPYLFYTLPLLLTVLSQWLINLGDRYVIGYFMGVDAVGIYSASYGLGSMLILFLTPLSGTLFPSIVKCYEANMIKELKTYLKYSLKFYLMLAVPGLLGLTVLSKSLLVTLTTTEFVLGHAVVPVVALGNLLYCCGFINTTILNLFKETKLVGIIFGSSALINITLNIIMVPLLGIMGAAIATMITFAIHMLVISRISFIKMPYEIDIKFILKCVISSIIMALVVWWLDPVGIIGILVSVGIGVIIYFSGLVFLGGFSREEFEFMIGIFTA